LSRRCEASALSLSNLVFFRHGGVKALRKSLFEAPGNLPGRHTFPEPWAKNKPATAVGCLAGAVE
jgi:hypothetical protein